MKRIASCVIMAFAVLFISPVYAEELNIPNVDPETMEVYRQALERSKKHRQVKVPETKKQKTSELSKLFGTDETVVKKFCAQKDTNISACIQNLLGRAADIRRFMRFDDIKKRYSYEVRSSTVLRKGKMPRSMPSDEVLASEARKQLEIMFPFAKEELSKENWPIGYYPYMLALVVAIVDQSLSFPVNEDFHKSPAKLALKEKWYSEKAWEELKKSIYEWSLPKRVAEEGYGISSLSYGRHEIWTEHEKDGKPYWNIHIYTAQALLTPELSDLGQEKLWKTHTSIGIVWEKKLFKDGRFKIDSINVSRRAR